LTRFTMTGPRDCDHKIVTIGWHNGRLFGDAETCEIVERLAAYYEGRPVGIAPLWTTTHDHLSEPHSAAHLMTRVFTLPRDITFTGSIPKFPPPPPGAVI
jgi:hypothetical protein